MTTITVKLDKKRASQLAHWASRRKTTKSEIIRQLIDRAEKIQTAEDLIAWVETNEGREFGLKH